MNITIDNVMNMTVPEEYRALSENQLREMGANLSDEGVVLRNEEDHVIIQVFWRKVPLFGGNGPLEKAVDVTAKQHQKQVPTYRNHQNLAKVIAGMEAAGFSYEYTANQIECKTIYYCTRYNKKFYAFSCSMRMENAARDEQLFDDILASVKLQG